MAPGRPVVMIGLDAMDRRWVEAMLAAGELPNLRRLRARGSFKRLTAEDAFLHAACWRSFLTGTTVEHHGWYFSKQWRAATGRIEPVTPDWLPMTPFWQALGAAGRRLLLVDVPHAPAPAAGFPGVMLQGWQTHDLGERGSAPAGLWDQLVERFGAPALGPERYGPQTAQSLGEVRDRALAALDQISAITAHLLTLERFDLALCVLGATHRAGHYLWDLSQLDPARLRGAERGRLQGALDEVYRAADHAVGRIVDAAPADAQIIVFAVHGMARNNGWVERFPAILERLREPRPARTRRLDPRPALRRLTRHPAVIRTTALVPRPIMARLSGLWTRRMYDWSKTPFFALPGELEGQIRLNLAQREPHGIVAPGRQRDALLDRLTEQLAGLRDLASDEPVAADIIRAEQAADTSGAAFQHLPDLVVRWRLLPCARSPGVRLPDGTELRWDPALPLPSGRSGNHRIGGWAVLGDADIVAAPGAPLSGLDLVRFLFDALEVPLPERLRPAAQRQALKPRQGADQRALSAARAEAGIRPRAAAAAR
jgi:predicted AlkP superfamily phosphohydrolase/phosphomutase